MSDSSNLIKSIRKSLFLILLIPCTLFSADLDTIGSKNIFFKNLENFYSKWGYKLKKASYTGDSVILEKHYEYLSKKHPKDLPIHWNLMTHYVKMGNLIKIKESTEKYRDALFERTSWYWRRHNLWYYLARSYGFDGNYKKSINFHLKSYRHNRYWTNNLFYLYEMYFKLSNYKKAKYYLRSYLHRSRIWSNTLKYAESWGHFYLRINKPKKAYKAYLRYCKRRPGDFWGYYKVFSFDYLKESEILKFSKSYIRYSRRSIESLYKITSYFINSKKYKLALKILNKLKKSYSSRYRIFYFMLIKADILTKLELYKKAADTFMIIYKTRKSLNAGFDELSYYINKTAGSLIRSREIKSAYLFIKKYMTSDFYNKEKMFFKIEEYFIRGQWEKAYTIAVKYFSTPKLDWNKLNFNDLKRLTIIAGRYKKKSVCRFLWGKFIEINPHPSYYLEYANYMKEMNNLQMAYELYKKAYTKAAYLRHILFDMVYIASKLKLEKDLGVLLNKAYCIYGIENVKRNIDENHPDLYARIKDLVYKKHSR